MRFLSINGPKWWRGSFVLSRQKDCNAAIADSGNFYSHHTRLPSVHLHFTRVLLGRSCVFLAEVFLIDLFHRLVAAAAVRGKFIGLRCCNIACWNVILGFFLWSHKLVQEQHMCIFIHSNQVNRKENRFFLQTIGCLQVAIIKKKQKNESKQKTNTYYITCFLFPPSCQPAHLLTKTFVPISFLVDGFSTSNRNTRS